MYHCVMLVCRVRTDVDLMYFAVLSEVMRNSTWNENNVKHKVVEIEWKEIELLKENLVLSTTKLHTIMYTAI